MIIKHNGYIILEICNNQSMHANVKPRLEQITYDQKLLRKVISIFLMSSFIDKNLNTFKTNKLIFNYFSLAQIHEKLHHTTRYFIY